LGKSDKGEKAGMVRLIGAFRLVKSVVLLALGLGLLKFLHRDIADAVQRWFVHWQFDPDNRYLQALLSKISNVNPRSVLWMSIGTIFYAGIFLVEGIGLLMLKRWAEYFTVIVTTSFIPLEVYHLVKHFSAMKIVVIVVNVAIVVYLIWKLKRHAKQ